MTDTSTNNTTPTTRKTRVRTAPYIRVALQHADDTWHFYESVRSISGVEAKRAVVLSGHSNTELMQAVRTATCLDCDDKVDLTVLDFNSFAATESRADQN